MPIPIDAAMARDLALRFDEALTLVRNEFKGLDLDAQYRNAFARVLKRDPLRRVGMCGTDQRDRFIPTLRKIAAETVPAGGRLLDIGGGDGQTFALLADQLPREVSVSLIEPNAGYARDYRAWLETQPHLRPGAVLVAGFDEAQAQPQTSLDYGNFHLVLSLHMLYFVADPAASLVRMARFLAPGGALAVVADEGRGYTSQVLRRFIEAGGDTGDNTASLDAIESRSRLLSGALRDILAKETPDARHEVDAKRQPTRLYGHTLGDLIALANIGNLAAVEDTAKFDAAADLLRANPEAVDLRIEDAGARKGMWSVTQPQHLAIVRRVS